MHQQGCKQDMASADLGRPNPKSLKLSVVPDLVRYYALSFPKHPPGSQKPLVTVIRENLVLSFRYRSRDTGRANSKRKSPLHPTGLSGIERPQPFCWKIDVWGSPRTSSCLPQTLIPWVLEKSLDRGKCKQRKTSGDCSQQLHFGTVSQTAASALQGRYLLGSLLARGNQMGASISCLHWLLGDGSREEGQWNRLAAQPGLGEGEDTNTRLRLWSESSKGHELSPNSHITSWCCECPGREPKPLLPHPRRSHWAGRVPHRTHVSCPESAAGSGGMAGWSRVSWPPAQTPAQLINASLWSGKHGVSRWGATVCGQNGN